MFLLFVVVVVVDFGCWLLLMLLCVKLLLLPCINFVVVVCVVLLFLIYVLCVCLFVFSLLKVYQNLSYNHN